jgi:tetratricopeptide (TPR) repeat protein
MQCSYPPLSVAVLLQEGLACHQQGRFDQAQACYAQVLQAQPDNADAWHLLGVLLGALGQSAQGIEHLQRAIRLRPEFAAAHNHLGNALRAGAQWDAAITAYRRALAVRPEYPVALNNLACAFKATDQLPEALAALRRAVSLDPACADAHYNLGNVYIALGDYQAALSAYQAALALRPNDVEILLALAKAWHHLEQSAPALAVLAQVLSLAPSCADAYNTLGAVHEQCGEIVAARDAYQQAVDLEPGRVDAQLSLGAAELRLGHFSAGWRGYAFRPAQSGVPDPLALTRHQVQPGALAGRSALLYAEQGLGDTLQFARFAPLLVDAGVTVGLVVQPPLKALLAASLPTMRVFAQGQALPAADAHWPLMSLPLVLDTTLASIPVPVPYVQAPEGAVRRWARRLPPSNARTLRIGVAWSGNPKHENDRRRSIPLTLFSTLMAGVDALFCVLQTEIRSADRAIVPSLGNLIDLSAEIDDYVDTAAIVANLDLIVTVDTSVAHLAGAMGKAVWVLLPYVPDWRWLLGRQDSPWYPSMRLFRQRTRGDWAEVLQRVAVALQRYRGVPARP